MAALQTVADFNTQNRAAPTAARSLARGTGSEAIPKKRPAAQAVEGKFRCWRSGCKKVYSAEENVEGACTYHPGNPVFGGNEKWWSCCPENGKFWEYDRFQGISKCCVGKHEDEIERYDRLIAERDGGGGSVEHPRSDGVRLVAPGILERWRCSKRE